MAESVNDVGTVQQIQLGSGGTNVTIVLRIYRSFPIYHDARFVIESSGFLGDQFVAVIPTANTEPKLADGAEVKCQEPFNLQEVARSAAGFIQRIDETAKKLDASVTDLRTQVLNAQTLANFTAAVTNMRAATEQALGAIATLNGLITTNGVQVGVAVSNVVQFSSKLDGLAVSAQTILDTNGVNLAAATRNIDDISVSVKQLAADLQAGKGLAGTMLQNRELATNVETIAANLSVTSSNLNRLGLWGILWSHKPPATNSTATQSPRNHQ